METNQDSMYGYVKHIVKPIFDKVLQETPPNHTMVGHNQPKSVTPSLYNPHNYRLYFSFTKECFNPKQGMVGVWFGKFKNYGKEFTALGEGVRITVKKTQVEVINKLTEQEWFVVSRTNAKKEIKQILEKIDKKCISSLKRFIEVYGGKTNFKIIGRENKVDMILNTKCDNKVMHEPFIDNIPLKTEFETSIVKKVYKEPNAEFTEPIYTIRHLENSALNEFAPQIVAAIKQVAMTHPGERLKYVQSQINEFSDIKKVYYDIMELSMLDKQRLSDWIFERFGT